MKFLFKGLFKAELDALEDLKQKIEKYKEKEQEFALASEANKNYYNEIASLKKESAFFNAQIIELKKEIESYKEKISSLTNDSNEKNALKIKLSELENNLKDVNDQNDKLKEFLSTKEQELAKVVNEKNDAEYKLRGLKDQSTLDASNNENLRNKISELEFVIKNLKEELLRSKSTSATKVLENNLKREIQKILVVDDSSIILMQVKNLFKSHYYNLQTANSAMKALEMLRKEEFDLVITDVNMPEMNGIELCLKLRKEFEGLKVIIMSSFENPKMKNQKSNLLFTGKPLDIKHILSLIESIKANDMGYLININLKDMIILLTLSKKEEVIQAKDLDGNQGNVFMAFGDLVHAEYLGNTGETALNMLLKAQLDFIDVFDGKTPEKTIETETALILSAF